MKTMATIAAALTIAVAAYAQPRYDIANMSREQLNRGVVAVRDDSGHVAVSWRSLSSDGKGEAFDVYRNGEKINDSALTAGGTFFVDRSPLAGDALYEVKGGGIDGAFRLSATAPAGYLPIKIDKPAGGITPDGRSYTYSANDASVGDMDGDGQYEIVLKWDPSNAHDNAHDGFTGSTLFDCYTLTGERLWRIDMGPNIRSGAHYVQFIVYDLDGDRRAEVMIKTADGTVDGCGNVIGDATADYRCGLEEAAKYYDTNRLNADKEREETEKMRQTMEEMKRQGKRPEPPQGSDGPGRGMSRLPGIERNSGRILSGPEYLTVFNGLTGEAMATVDYIPERGNMAETWGDDNGNRSERYLAGVGYFDGKKASALFCRGYYTRSVLAAWDWDGHQLTNRWTFDTDADDGRWLAYAGQGNHNLRIADIDGDGCDEIIYGAMAVDNDGTGIYSTGMGHGDAMHLTAFDPATARLQVWDCHENRRDGSELHDAATGDVVFQIRSDKDVGRCMAADIDPTNIGVEMWSSESGGIWNIKGEKVTPAAAAQSHADSTMTSALDDTALFIDNMRLPTNSAVWWDGDLLREMLDNATVSKYDWNTGRMNTVTTFDGCSFNNGTKSNPCLSADIIGDWREEVLVRTDDSSELRLYISAIPTAYRINCLMEDIPYRISVATENIAYNQPPETGFYLGPDKSVTEFLK